MANKDFKSYLSEIFGVDDAAIAGAAALGGYAAGRGAQPGNEPQPVPEPPPLPANANLGHDGATAAFPGLNPIEQQQIDNLYYKFKAIPDKSDWPQNLRDAMDRYEQLRVGTDQSASSPNSKQINETVPDQFEVYRFIQLVNQAYAMKGQTGSLKDQVKGKLLNQLSQLLNQYKQLSGSSTSPKLQQAAQSTQSAQNESDELARLKELLK